MYLKEILHEIKNKSENDKFKKHIDRTISSDNIYNMWFYFEVKNSNLSDDELLELMEEHSLIRDRCIASANEFIEKKNLSLLMKELEIAHNSTWDLITKTNLRIKDW